MTLPETLGANVTRLVHARVEREVSGLCHIWTTLAREGWPDDARMASRAVWIKRIAAGRWTNSPESLEILAAVLEVHPWELLRPCTPLGRYPDAELEGEAL